MTTRYFTGLDLGGTQEYTALAVLEQTKSPDPQDASRLVRHYGVRHLHRFPLGTPYTEVAAYLSETFRTAPLTSSVLAVDQTAVGKPVVDLIRRARLRAGLRPITITSSHRATLDEAGGWLVPRKELVSTLQVLLQARRIKVAPTLPEAKTLLADLLLFRQAL